MGPISPDTRVKLGGEDLCVEALPGPEVPGDFPHPEGTREARDVALDFGIPENQTDFSSVATSGPPRGSHCPRGGGSAPSARPRLTLITQGRFQGVHAEHPPIPPSGSTTPGSRRCPYVGEWGFLGLGSRVRSFGSVTVRRKTERLAGATGVPESARGRGGKPGGVARDCAAWAGVRQGRGLSRRVGVSRRD